MNSVLHNILRKIWTDLRNIKEIAKVEHCQLRAIQIVSMIINDSK